jgi:hypothetical protein
MAPGEVPITLEGLRANEFCPGRLAQSMAFQPAGDRAPYSATNSTIDVGDDRLRARAGGSRRRSPGCRSAGPDGDLGQHHPRRKPHQGLGEQTVDDFDEKLPTKYPICTRPFVPP